MKEFIIPEVRKKSLIERIQTLIAMIFYMVELLTRLVRLVS